MKHSARGPDVARVFNLDDNWKTKTSRNKKEQLRALLGTAPVEDAAAGKARPDGILAQPKKLSSANHLPLVS
ncbi:hypothetical protein [Arthrobacter sp. UYCu723]